MDTRLSWPPPGLEKLHGTLWPLVRRAAVGAALFTFPLLVAIATEQSFTSLGPFGTSYWIPALTAAIALFVLLSTAGQLSSLLRQAAHGARLGYDLRMLLIVAADESHDSGFLLQGARIYESMSADARRNLLYTRVLGPMLYLFAALWLPAGLCLSAALGLAGSIAPGAMWWVTVAPAALFGAAGLAARALAGTLRKQATKRAARAQIEERVVNDAALWRYTFEDVAAGVMAPGRAPRPQRLRFASAVVFVPALLLILPVLAIASVTVLGPIVATVAAPNYGNLEARVRSLDLVREYAVPKDPGISPTEGGRALANLTYLTHRELTPLLQPPVRWVDPIEYSSVGVERLVEADSIGLQLRAHSFSAKDHLRIQAAALGDANAEVSTVARASGLDITGTRWVMPFPDTLRISMLPIARFGGVREAAHMHIMRGYQLYMDGDYTGAEQMMRETISLGLQWADNAPTAFDAFMGRVIAFRGARGLRNLYIAAGRDVEAERLAEKIKASNLLTTGTRPLAGDVRLTLAGLPKLIADPSISRAHQWEALAAFSTFGPCLNLHRAVFAADAKYDAWMSSARERLVRYPADQQLFELARKGMLPTGSAPRCTAPLPVIRELL